jgi:hypothetical protein
METPTFKQGRNIAFTLIVRKKGISTVANWFGSAILRMKEISCPLISMFMTLGNQLK